MTTLQTPYKIFCKYDELVAVDALKEHPKNPNTHPEDQVTLISRVIMTNGWRMPIIVSKLSGYIVKGHGRYQAALRAGWQSVPVEYQEYSSNVEELADLVADNKIAELSFFSNDDLSMIIADIKFEFPDYDFMSSFGLSDVEIKSLVEGWNPQNSSVDDIDPKDEEAPSTIKVKCQRAQEEQLKEAIKKLLVDYPGASVA